MKYIGEIPERFLGVLSAPCVSIHAIQNHKLLNKLNSSPSSPWACWICLHPYGLYLSSRYTITVTTRQLDNSKHHAGIVNGSINWVRSKSFSVFILTSRPTEKCMNGFVKLINFWRLADTTIGFNAMSAFWKMKNCFVRLEYLQQIEHVFLKVMQNAILGVSIFLSSSCHFWLNLAPFLFVGFNH